ncbi:hypothetical protein COE51_01445 [Bacillus pseudomycoides]|nr:hypothetical protein COE51_01445 [Bacillus pseudomycoides]
MLGEKFDALIEEVIEQRTNNMQQELTKVKEVLSETRNLLFDAKLENKKLKSKLDQINEFESFKGIINSDNFKNFVGNLGLKETGIELYGMGSERIPLWFNLLVTYYDERERIFTLMDMFEIGYPQWAKTFKLPFDYNENELDLVFKYMGKMYVCNGCIFEHNMGFYFEYQNRYSGSLERLFSKESYVEIPWNLLLQNKLLTSEKYFDKIVDSLSKNRSHSEYFFRIQDYQTISEEQVIKMFPYLPKSNLYDIHKRFINNNINILKHRIDLAEQLKSKINDNQHSTFCYLNYPLDMQIEFVKGCSNNYSTIFPLVNKMEISKEEKLQLLSEIAEKLL